MIYIASPYAHPEEAVTKYRLDESARYAAFLLRNGVNAYSPLAHGAKLCDFMPPGKDNHGTWMPHDFEMLSYCSHLYVLALDGWKQSRGVLLEIGYAVGKGLPIFLVTPKPDGTYSKVEFTSSHLV